MGKGLVTLPDALLLLVSAIDQLAFLSANARVVLVFGTFFNLHGISFKKVMAIARTF